MIKRLLSFTLCLLFVLSVGLGTCLAASQEIVTMSMQDYLTLRNDFLILKQNNEKQQQLLNQLKEQLAQSETLQNLSSQDWLMLKQQLTEAQKKAMLLESQLAQLEQQLQSAKQSSLTAEQRLQSANQSLAELTKAIKKERAAAKQRELILKVAVVVATAYAATK